jgi:hypothetical protein
MRKIYKYPVELDSEFDGFHEVILLVPEGTKFLCIQLQNGKPCIWAEIEKGVPCTEVTLISVGTGHGAVPEAMRYLGTVVQPDGLVFHVYVP